MCLPSDALLQHPVQPLFGREGGFGTVERSYPASKLRSGGRDELPLVQGQWQPGEATSCLRPGAVTLRSHPEPEARGGSWEEPPMPDARAGGWEEQPDEPWLCRPRRA